MIHRHWGGHGHLLLDISDKLKSSTPNFSHRPTLWNNLPENIQRTKSISQVKHFFSRNDTNPAPFFYNCSRKAQITYCKLRFGISDLKYDLLNRHLTTNSSCDCGERKEISEHYILHCPRFTHVHQNTIFRIPANLLNITTLLQGDPNISSADKKQQQQ